MNKTLYGLTKASKIKIWNISVKSNIITITHGLENGKQQSKSESVNGVNIGKSNATSDSQQAILEANSKYKKQLDKGYRPTKEELQSLPLLPMLVKDFRKEGHRLKFPCLACAKLDGLRCLAFWKDNRVVLLSRGGKEYEVAHIKDELQKLPEDIILDGELYIHNLDLEDIVSAVKKPNSNTPKLKLVVFDIVDEGSFEERLKYLNSLRPKFENNIVQFLNYSNSIHNIQEIKDLNKNFVQTGYEGTILRNFDGLYEPGKRSADVFKYKDFVDDEFEIVDIEKDKNDNAVFVLYSGSATDTFTCTYGDFDQRKEFLANKKKYIGKWLTVKYQKLYRKTKKPQFPTGITVRDYE